MLHPFSPAWSKLGCDSTEICELLFYSAPTEPISDRYLLPRHQSSQQKCITRLPAFVGPMCDFVRQFLLDTWQTGSARKIPDLHRSKSIPLLTPFVVNLSSTLINHTDKSHWDLFQQFNKQSHLLGKCTIWAGEWSGSHFTNTYQVRITIHKCTFHQTSQ